MDSRSADLSRKTALKKLSEATDKIKVLDKVAASLCDELMLATNAACTNGGRRSSSSQCGGSGGLDDGVYDEDGGLGDNGYYRRADCELYVRKKTRDELRLEKQAEKEEEGRRRARAREVERRLRLLREDEARMLSHNKMVARQRVDERLNKEKEEEVEKEREKIAKSLNHSHSQGYQRIVSAPFAAVGQVSVV